MVSEDKLRVNTVWRIFKELGILGVLAGITGGRFWRCRFSTPGSPVIPGAHFAAEESLCLRLSAVSAIMWRGI